MVRIAIGLAYRQLTHRGAKLIGALSGVTVAILLIFTQLGFRGALYDSSVSASSKFDADIVLTGREFRTMAFPWPWMPLHVVQDALGVDGVLSSAPFYGSTVQFLNPADGRSLTTWIFAYDPAKPVFAEKSINDQRQVISLPETALIDTLSRNEINGIAEAVRRTGRVDLVFPAPSSTIQPVFKVRGTFEIGPTINIDGNIITSDLNYFRFLGIPLDRVGLGVLRVAPGHDVATVMAALRQRFGDQIRVFDKAAFIANEKGYYAENTPIGFIFGAGLVVGVVVGIVFITQVLHGIVSDNMREYATLRAMGYKQKFFLILVGAIALTVSVVTYIPGAIAAYFVYELAGSATKLPMLLKTSYLVEVFVLVLTMGLVATFMSTKKLKQADPVDLF